MLFFLLMILRPRRYPRTDTPFPSTTLFRSQRLELLVVRLGIVADAAEHQNVRVLGLRRRAGSERRQQAKQARQQAGGRQAQAEVRGGRQDGGEPSGNALPATAPEASATDVRLPPQAAPCAAHRPALRATAALRGRPAGCAGTAAAACASPIPAPAPCGNRSHPASRPAARTGPRAGRGWRAEIGSAHV